VIREGSDSFRVSTSCNLFIYYFIVVVKIKVRAEIFEVFLQNIFYIFCCGILGWRTETIKYYSTTRTTQSKVAFVVL
jgi:hypothetical protein